jgi:hypothetical protein
MEETPKDRKLLKCPAFKWVKRFGVAGFMFFLIKGLLWLAVLFGATYFGFEAAK